MTYQVPGNRLDTVSDNAISKAGKHLSCFILFLKCMSSNTMISLCHLYDSYLYLMGEKSESKASSSHTVVCAGAGIWASSCWIPGLWTMKLYEVWGQHAYNTAPVAQKWQSSWRVTHRNTRNYNMQVSEVAEHGCKTLWREGDFDLALERWEDFAGCKREGRAPS